MCNYSYNLRGTNPFRRMNSTLECRAHLVPSTAPQGMGHPPSSFTLPTDHIRRVMWRFAELPDLQTLVQRARAVARGPVARLVANGARRTHEWTADKNELLAAFDKAGITAVFTGQAAEFDEKSANLARALIASELAWVDAGAATSLLAGLLALAPIDNHGTSEQKLRYLRTGEPFLGGEPKKTWRGAFCLTEPIPYAGSDASILGGTVSIAEWKPGDDPMLRVLKSGRYITNMGFADFVVAAVESNDARIRGSCLVILENDDLGLFDRGIPTRKLAHQLSSTSDPKFDLRVPASRILGGYSVQDGCIVPNFSHGALIEPVLKRSRVIVGLLTSAKLLSTVEPIIRYHRERFRGANHTAPGTPRYQLGLQQHPDVLHRLVEIWASGEAGASLGFAAARLFDVLDSVERRANAILEEKGIHGRGKLRACKAVVPDAIRYFETEHTGLRQQPPKSEDDALVQLVLLQAEANLLAPAVKLWNTGVGATVMREAVSLVGGAGITEECPGFLGYKWIDAQLEATYEGPEALQRRSLASAISHELFSPLWTKWTAELRLLGSDRRRGAGVLAAAMDLWFWTYNFLRRGTEGMGRIFRSQGQGVAFPLVDALSWLVAARQFILDVHQLATSSGDSDHRGAENIISFYEDLCHIQSVRAAGEAARICTELASGVREVQADETNGERHEFISLRSRLDRSLAGFQLAKARAAEAVSKIAIPDKPDYPK